MIFSGFDAFENGIVVREGVVVFARENLARLIGGTRQRSTGSQKYDGRGNAI
jgi:hypothetical protein